MGGEHPVDGHRSFLPSRSAACGGTVAPPAPGGTRISGYAAGVRVADRLRSWDERLLRHPLMRGTRRPRDYRLPWRSRREAWLWWPVAVGTSLLLVAVLTALFPANPRVHFGTPSAAVVAPGAVLAGQLALGIARGRPRWVATRTRRAIVGLACALVMLPFAVFLGALLEAAA